MATLIHSKIIGNKKIFRVWSTETDTYVTEEMSEEEVRDWTYQQAILKATMEHESGIDDRIERAIKKGTSSLTTESREKPDKWEDEL